MKYQLYSVYLVDFKGNIGGELSGKHYAVALTNEILPDNIILVAPITSKKKGKKYRGGISIKCTDYQKNPSAEKAFIRTNKIREVSVLRVLGTPIYTLNQYDIERLKKSIVKGLKLSE